MLARTLTRQQARELDRLATEDFGVPGIVLMENAGRGVADKLCQLGVSGLVVICCGIGNNGGDGFVIARHLDLRGIEVRVLLWGDPQRLPPDSTTNYRILERSAIPLVNLPGAEGLAPELEKATWIVDALLGTGARGEPRPPLDAVIEAINTKQGRIVAVDVPSGLDCDTGLPAHHTIRATHTCTFVAPKPGFFVPGAEQFTGAIHVLDIGAPAKLVEQMLSEANPPGGR